MSAPINNTCFKILLNFTKNHRKFVQNSSLKCLSSLTKFRFYSTSTEKSIKDEETLFIRPDVQKILSKITGFNLDKIFGFRQVPDVAAPKYKLLTDAELQEQNEETKLRAQKKLQMAPVKKAWNVDHSTMKVISSDQEIANFERSSCQYVFTDITYGIPNRDRIVAVRETSGLLRLADNKERDRTLQVYFPRPGKMYNMPKLFEEENLEKVLGEERYVYVLDRACVQFEPDDPDYIRVTRRTYEHMASNKKFDDLRSTRHFGPMVFYFAFHKRIDDLLIDMLHRNLLDDADSLVKLFHIMHPDCKSADESLKNKITDTYELIRTFAAHDAMKSTPLEQALDAHQMQHEQISRQQSNK